MLTLILVAMQVTLAMVIAAPAPAKAAPVKVENCVTPPAFISQAARNGNVVEPIPAANMPAARALMAITKLRIPADAAWYVETPKHIAGVTYAYGGCIIASVAVPAPENRLTQLRGILLGERL